MNNARQGTLTVLLMILMSLPVVGGTFDISLVSGETMLNLHYDSLTDSTLVMRESQTELGVSGGIRIVTTPIIIPIQSIKSIESPRSSRLGYYTTEKSRKRGLNSAALLVIPGTIGGAFAGLLWASLVTTGDEQTEELQVTFLSSISLGSVIGGAFAVVAGYRFFSTHTFGRAHSESYDFSDLSFDAKHTTIQSIMSTN